MVIAVSEDKLEKSMKLSKKVEIELKAHWGFLRIRESMTAPTFWVSLFPKR